MDSRSASGLQQVGRRLRRSLCSDRRNPASDLLRPPRELSYKARICDIKALALAHAIAARRSCASSELRPVLVHRESPW